MVVIIVNFLKSLEKEEYLFNHILFNTPVLHLKLKNRKDEKNSTNEI